MPDSYEEAVKARARKAIGRTWWLREDGTTVALSFAEICDVIREFYPTIHHLGAFDA